MRQKRRKIFLFLCCVGIVATYFFLFNSDKTSNAEILVQSEDYRGSKEQSHVDHLGKIIKHIEPSKSDSDVFFASSVKPTVNNEQFNVDILENNNKPENLIEIAAKINNEQVIYNKNTFNYTADEIKAVIIIQVHKRKEYFKELLKSLQYSKGIESVLLVISNDFYSVEMNELIRSIDFCQVMQIFFPYSMQLYPSTFPGQSDEDCARDLSRKRALEIGCQNAETPDQYGHYREAGFTMTKHHWWWKINRVMDDLNATKGFDGPFLFLEEDHYVASSFLDALSQLHSFKTNDPKCENSCDILSLGSYKKSYNFRKNGHKVEHRSWISNEHNMGMVLYRKIWENIKQCSEMFCTYDDYNWDWTLMHMSQKCLPRELNVIVYEVPRVYHVGVCGLHHKENCNNNKEALNQVKEMLLKQRDYLFQKAVLLKKKSDTIRVTPNGGWGDPRDHRLCKSFVKATRNI